jgi:Reverse transcriptase (RNA-dependent DNA polymerase)
MLNQARIKSYKRAIKYMYGFPIPRSYEEALRFDARNGNHLWDDATALELKQLNEYDTFVDLGPGQPIPSGYKRIHTHLIYAVKHDGRHKARMVADGHLTDVPLESVYSGVVSLRSLRLVLFLAELNELEAWATDVGNAYLEATTNEKVAIVAGPKYGQLKGHTLIIHKALYGLKLSGKMWYQRFADCLREMKFQPSKADPCVWMRLNQEMDVYEYVAVYVDDLAFVMKDPEAFTKTLQEKYHFNLKGSGPIEFHLGCDFFRDDDNVLCMAPRKYIDKMVDAYTRMFGEPPKRKYSSPLEKGDHPESDLSPLLNDEGITQYQSLIGMMQWAISLGRFDINTAVMTLSSFAMMPRQGHLDRAKRVCGYLWKMKHATVRFRTGIPDYSNMTEQPGNWDYSVYGTNYEIIPKDAPVPKGRKVVFTHYVNANLYHDLLTGKSVTGILHLLNQTPIDWYCKKQPTVETATYGAEFVAARTCVEQIVDLRTTLRYMGVPVASKSYMFGDNESVVKSSTIPESKLHKRHNALSYHKVREAILAGYILFTHLIGSRNPADILSKHWGYADVWPTMKVVLFWKGDTMDTLKNHMDQDIA